MSDVRTVFTTTEVAEKLGISANYLLRLAKKIGMSVDEMRPVGKRNYLFSEEAVAKIANARKA